MGLQKYPRLYSSWPEGQSDIQYVAWMTEEDEKNMIKTVLTKTGKQWRFHLTSLTENLTRSDWSACCRKRTKIFCDSATKTYGRPGRILEAGQSWRRTIATHHHPGRPWVRLVGAAINHQHSSQLPSTVYSKTNQIQPVDIFGPTHEGLVEMRIRHPTTRYECRTCSCSQVGKDGHISVPFSHIRCLHEWPTPSPTAPASDMNFVDMLFQYRFIEKTFKLENSIPVENF